jgi:hypothetical protein
MEIEMVIKMNIEDVAGFMSLRKAYIMNEPIELLGRKFLITKFLLELINERTVSQQLSLREYNRR